MDNFSPQPIKEPPGNMPPVVQPGFYQANKFYIWAVGLAVIIIAFLAYLAFRPAAPLPAKEANVEVQIQAPDSLPSGGDAVYRISLRNNDNVKLTGLELELTYPEGIAYLESSPKAGNISGSIFSVPDLSPGQNASVIVKTKTSGDINSEKKLIAKLHYKYTNFNSSFVKIGEHTLRLTASDVVLEMEGPKETNTAQLVAFSVIYKNNSKNTIKNARIKLTYPVGFNYGSSQPAAVLGGNVWNIGDLQSNAEGKITLQGAFSGSGPGEEKKLTAEFQTLGPSGEFYVQSTAEYKTVITSAPLLVTLENLDQRGSGVVSPGETLDFAVRFQNNSPVAATGVNVAVTLDSKALDLANVQAQGAQVVGNTITWNAAGAPSLLSLNPSESGVLNFFVRVKNPAVKDSSKHLSITIAAKIKANEYSTFLPGESLVLKVASPAQIQAGLAYISGALPPKVGTETKYKVKFSLLNSSNDFSQGEVAAFLPSAGGSFDQTSVSAGERENVQFDPATGKLLWKVGSLPAYAGKFSPAKILEFEVTIGPGPSNAGESMALVRSIRFFAKDNFTEQEVNIRTEDITTASLEGQQGYSNGIVAP